MRIPRFVGAGFSGRRWAAAGVAATIAALASALIANAWPATAENGDTAQPVAVCPPPPSVEPADPASDYFLKIDGIAGESTDVKHLGEIAIASYVWGINLGNPTSCTKPAQSATFSGVSFSKRLDRASPKLAQAAATGAHIPVAVLTARKSVLQARCSGRRAATTATA